MEEPMQKANLLGVQVSVTDYAAVVERVIAAARGGRSLVVTAADVHEIMQAHADPVFAAVLNSFDIVTPDGQPLRWGMRWTRQARLAERVYGPTLMLQVCAAAANQQLPVLFYGGRSQTLERLSRRLSARLPALQIGGSIAGTFRPLSTREQDEHAARIRESGARIVFVGMGCPRQEWWMYHMRKRLQLPMLGVGAAFDFHAGTIKQAPPWMQARGLEWLYRLSREPRRLSRRYLVITPRYLPLIGLQALRPRTFACPTDLSAASCRPCPG
jgi:N-acetylglucosaminyldiphosphoundecaprenol N-acetyl-beta-D-mannosaminyltransferase